MGHIKEPMGVDFYIKSEPLTDQAREEISAFIRNYQNKTSTKSPGLKSNLKKQHRPK
jgi:hypothetical protein